MGLVQPVPQVVSAPTSTSATKVLAAASDLSATFAPITYFTRPRCTYACASTIPSRARSLSARVVILDSAYSPARTISEVMYTIARYSLDGPVLPLLAATLPLAEAARRALMSRYRKLMEFDRYGRAVPPDAERFASPVFSGKDEQGIPIRGDHGHAFYLPTDEDGDGRLDHLTVFAQGGFPATRSAPSTRSGG